jgi:hypothetical protein
VSFLKTVLSHQFSTERKLLYPAQDLRIVVAVRSHYFCSRAGVPPLFVSLRIHGKKSAPREESPRLDSRRAIYDYVFTTRAQFSLGRDLKLSPAQGGRPLNYFVFPYVEVDGQEYPNVSLAFSFEDANAAAAAR